MKHYYIDPTSLNLIVRDTEKNEINIVERIEKVRVFTLSEVRMGDFSGANPNDIPDKFDKVGAYRNPYLHEGGNHPAKGESNRRMRVSRGAAPSDQDDDEAAIEPAGPPKRKRMRFLAPERIEQMKALAGQGKSVREIAAECNVSYGTAYKYSKQLGGNETQPPQT